MARRRAKVGRRPAAQRLAAAARPLACDCASVRNCVLLRVCAPRRAGQRPVRSRERGSARRARVAGCARHRQPSPPGNCPLACARSYVSESLSELEKEHTTSVLSLARPPTPLALPQLQLHSTRGTATAPGRRAPRPIIAAAGAQHPRSTDHAPHARVALLTTAAAYTLSGLSLSPARSSQDKMSEETHATV